MMSTTQFAENAEKRYCKEFGVDKFCTSESFDYEPIIRNEIIYTKILFWGWLSERKKYFYPMVFSWTKKGRDFSVRIEPILKEVKQGKDTLYYIDEEKVKEELHKCIEQSGRIINQEKSNEIERKEKIKEYIQTAVKIIKNIGK